MSKYLKIEISQTLFTDLYVEVSDDYNGVPQVHVCKPDIRKKIVERARKLDSIHWEKDDVQVEATEWTTAEEAKEYGVEEWTL